MTDLTTHALKLTEGWENQDKAKVVRDSLLDSADLDWMKKVTAFHYLYDAPIHNEPTEGLPQMSDERLKLRLDLIEEEFGEGKEHTAKRDIVEIADALGDIIYVVCGYAIEAGVDLAAVVKEIHASNMTKLGADGKPVISDGTGEYPKGKVLKGPDYRKPDIRKALGLS